MSVQTLETLGQFVAYRPCSFCAAPTSTSVLTATHPAQCTVSAHKHIPLPLEQSGELECGRSSTTMPSHLHPRSRSTSILFTGTLLAGFIVVGLPHILPCPAPRKRFADSTEQILIGPDGQQIRLQRQRRRRKVEEPREDSAGVGSPETLTSNVQLSSRDSVARNDSHGPDQTLNIQREMLLQAQEEAVELEKQARECPVPKPKSLIGSILGLQNTEESSGMVQHSPRHEGR